MRSREFLYPRKAALHDVVHPDVLVESLHTEFHVFELGLGSVRQQRIFVGGKTDEPLGGQFEPDAAAFDPAAQGGDGR